MPKMKQRTQDLNIRAHHDNDKLKKYWKYQIAELDGHDISPTNGRVRTKHEKFLVLMAIKMVLKIYIGIGGPSVIRTINWTKIEKEVAKELHVRDKNVHNIRLQYFEDGDVFVTTKSDEKADDDQDENEAEAERVENSRKLNNNQLEAMVMEVDQRHADGKAVTNQLMRNFLFQKYNIQLSKSTLSNYFKILGLSYKPIKSKRKNMGAYRMDMLRDFIIPFSEKYGIWKEDEENCPFVFVFTDESYVHRRLGLTNSYFGKKSKEFNRSTSKGDRLIIMHAICSKGPLTEYDDAKQPVDRLEWTGDTPRPYPDEDGLLSCETIWKATTKTGDYHQNMSSKMFLKWVTECLIPTFESLHKGKKMVLIMDNAAYHHKREIDSLSSLTKEELVVMASNFKCTHINIPITEQRHDWLIAANNIDFIMNYDGLTCDVLFDDKRFIRAASKQNPFIPTVDELRRGLLSFIADNNPEELVCEVEQIMTKHGHTILWTPPYTPELQPIEMFWAAGKNNVRYRNTANTTNRDVVEYLRVGWYGNEHLFDDDDDDAPKPYDLLRKAPVDCRALIEHCVGLANTKYIKLCAGIKGTMGNLWVDPKHVRCTEGVPVDWMMNDLGVDKLQADNDDDSVDDEVRAIEEPNETMSL